MPDYIDQSLGHLAAKLRARYPGVRIVYATIGSTSDGTVQQNIRYQAPLEVLISAGLLTSEMIMISGNPHKESRTALGEGFHLTAGLDCESIDGHFDLSIWTGAAPRERDRMRLTEAKKILRRYAKRQKLVGVDKRA